jgi:hypothetical protein
MAFEPSLGQDLATVLLREAIDLRMSADPRGARNSRRRGAFGDVSKESRRILPKRGNLGLGPGGPRGRRSTLENVPVQSVGTMGP